jgi:hypothetical protein
LIITSTPDPILQKYQRGGHHVAAGADDPGLNPFEGFQYVVLAVPRKSAPLQKHSNPSLQRIGPIRLPQVVGSYLSSGVLEILLDVDSGNSIGLHVWFFAFQAISFSNFFRMSQKTPIGLLQSHDYVVIHSLTPTCQIFAIFFVAKTCQIFAIFFVAKTNFKHSSDPLYPTYVSS